VKLRAIVVKCLGVRSKSDPPNHMWTVVEALQGLNTGSPCCVVLYLMSRAPESIKHDSPLAAVPHSESDEL
jgi:hypothetical protein